MAQTFLDKIKMTYIHESTSSWQAGAPKVLKCKMCSATRASSQKNTYSCIKHNHSGFKFKTLKMHYNTVGKAVCWFATVHIFPTFLQVAG